MALYHKHRPQTFASIVGQEHIETTIMNQVATGKVAHAYLFSGPRGVGKTTTARVLAKAMQCKARTPGTSEPCETCSSCQDITASRAIDVIEIDAASHTGVDNVRENIIDNAQFKPTFSPYKIFIIDEVHMLSTSAFNALLKTLEEPPKHVLFILATTELHKLPETIVSRCQRFHFKKIPYDTMKKHIDAVAKEEGIQIESAVVDRIIRKSDGCARDAVSLLDQLMSAGDKSITAETAALLLPPNNDDDALRFITACLAHDTHAALELLASLGDQGVHFPEYGMNIISLLRALMLHKANPQGNDAGTDLAENTKKQIDTLSRAISNPDVVRFIDLLLARVAEMKSAVLPQLPLELAAVEWCEAGSMHAEVAPPVNNTATPSTEMNRNKKIETGNTSPPKVEVAVVNTDNAVKLEPITASVPLPVEADKKIVPEPVTNSIQPDGTYTKDQATVAWKACLKQLDMASPSIANMLRMATITGVTSQGINLTVPYSFHKDALTRNGVQKKLEVALEDILKQKVALEVAVQSVEEKASDTANLQDLAAAFGGEVISV